MLQALPVQTCRAGGGFGGAGGWGGDGGGGFGGGLLPSQSTAPSF